MIKDFQSLFALQYKTHIPLKIRSLAFSFILNRIIPYTGTIKSQVIFLEPGHARVEMKDRRMLRNHLNCLHAIAVANLGEFVTGLALNSALPPQTRGILKSFRIDYLKKARGPLQGQSKIETEITSTDQPKVWTVPGTIWNKNQECVAEVVADWLVSPC